MTVTVEPREFRYVMFDAAEIERALVDVLELVGFAARDVHLSIDEASTLAAIRAEERADGSLLLSAGSGAFEDTRRLRSFSPSVTATNVGRVLMRVGDRADGSFADAPADAELTRAQMAAWDTYSMGRLARRGLAVHPPRWRYAFRNRYGFSDETDIAFDRLWNATQLTWATLVAISQTAASLR